MRFLSAFLITAVLALPQFASGHGSHRSHIVDTDDGLDIQIVRTDDEHWASYTRDGVRYVTTDSSVLEDIDKAMEKHRRIGREHAELGRKHAELGRDHAELGREHARLGREHARLARSGDEDAQRALEAEQRKLEDKQRVLEDRQRKLEAEQRELERKQKTVERESYRDIQQIFERAVREGRAKRD
jgi:hypothetical protein